MLKHIIKSGGKSSRERLQAFRASKTDRIFLLGMGAQKGGTTWLHQYLAASKSTDFGFRKEYHVLDALYIPQCEHVYRGYTRKALKNLQSPEHNRYRFSENADLWRRVGFLGDVNQYYDYFCRLLSQPGISLTGDLTPSYAGLPLDAILQLKEQFAARGVSVKSVFLMRDPFERSWSIVRMQRRKKASRTKLDSFSQSEEEAFIEEFLGESPDEFRNLYDQTLTNLDKAFAAQDCYIGFYETLFSKDEVRRLCKAIGIPYVKPDFNKRVNVSQKSTAISDTTQANFVERYRATYLAIMDRFGEDRVRQLWPSARFI